MSFHYMDLLALKEGEGATLKKYELVSYKSGWQVATDGYECCSTAAAWACVRAMGGTCGIWLENGIYYIDRSKRMDTKKEALEVGRDHNQISIYGWKLGRLVYC